MTTAPQVLQVVMLVLILWLIEGLLVDYAGLFDICVIEAPAQTSFFSSLLFWGAILSLFALFAIATISSRRATIATISSRRATLKFELQRRALFALAFLFLWWFATFMFIQTSSSILADTTCHRRQGHNSVSGHYGFFIYWCLSALWLVRLAVDDSIVANYLAPALLQRSWRANPTAKALSVVAGVLLACSAWTLLRSWTLGYHSLRQCLLGAAVAVSSHYFATNSLDHLLFALSADRWQWARVWTLRTVVALLVVTAVLELIATRSTSLQYGEAAAVLIGGAICVSMVGQTARRIDGGENKTPKKNTKKQN